MPTDSAVGLTLSEQAPLASVTIDGNQPVSQFWNSLFEHHSIQQAVIDTVRSVARGKTVVELYEELDDRDVPYWLWSWIRDVARGDDRAAEKLATILTPRLGSGHSTIEDILRTAELFESEEISVTISVQIKNSFFKERDRQQREEILTLISILSRGFDIRLVAPRVTRAKLRKNHRQDLAAVSDWQIAPRETAPVSETVEQALVELDPDGRAVTLLRELRESASQAHSYSALYAAATVSNDRVRQLIGQLSDLGLIERFGPNTDRHVELLAAGDAYLDALDAEAGFQQTLDDAVSRTRKASQQAVYSAQAREGGKDGSGPYRTRFSDRARHVAAVGCSTERTVTLVSEPNTGGESTEEGRTKFISHMSGRDEVVASVRATGGFQYIVSKSTALANAGLLEQLITDDRLSSLDDSPRILREARNIGALSDEALEDAETLRENLIEWGEEIEEMTTDLNHGEYDDRDRFRGQIMRSAHGLAGSIVHLFEAFGIDIIRDVRVPDDLNERHLNDLSKTIAVSAAIQSQYGCHAAYRQLFETDAGRPDIVPTVDAEAPSGHLIGSFVLRGSDIHRLRGPLEARLSRPADLHEEASEFVISVPIRTAGRGAYRRVAGMALKWKNLRLTDETMRLLHTLSPSPFHTAEGICRGLAKDASTRDLRIDEVRTILTPLGADVLLPELPPTVGKIISALLRSEGRFTQTELAEAAGVSPRSVSNHRDALEGLGLVAIGAAGWRLSLSYTDPEAGERYEPVVPETVGGAFIDAIDSLLVSVLTTEAYADPEHFAASTVYWPPDPWRLVESDHELSRWAAVAARLTGSTRSAKELDEERIIEMGPEIEQVPISKASDGGVSV